MWTYKYKEVDGDLNNEKLNMLAESYRFHKCSEVFAELYSGLMEERFIHEKIITRSGYGSRHEALRIFDDCLLTVLSMPEIKDFCNLFRRALRLDRINHFKTEKRRRSRYGMDIEDAPTSLINIEDDLEVVVLEKLVKKKKDQQLQLLISLHESAKIPFDSKMVAAIEELPRFTLRSLAKAIGVDHKKLTRKLERLARAYDRNIHGDLSEYISPHLRLNRKYLAG